MIFHVNIPSMDLLDLNNEECCDHQTFLLEFLANMVSKSYIQKKYGTKENKKETKKIQIAHIKLFTSNKKTTQNKFLFPAEYIDQIHKILLFKMDKDSFIACLGWFRSKTGIKEIF